MLLFYLAEICGDFRALQILYCQMFLEMIIKMHVLYDAELSQTTDRSTQ